ncbi:ribose-phosphate pyrophosphokinase [Noviherbaspirillum sp. CPCC 100848]|uniref:ribose-phosphate diphosphokinase n=1 Tax=Noviherbaspirillum album TaxID=3080276 RepID=A0ABU6JIT2_9BURK|nr:ribose-phosphate pyrophosphokinase [Noviherbaspirillum sp. CPCC 100848]MEC4722969.1 ribose-phosphate pyrophosphokinase [Noviherbaspirillum sp. CPCC 100848]
MKSVLFPLPGNEAFAASVSKAMSCELGELETRLFPDGESYVRLLTPVKDREVTLLCTLHKPDDKLIRLYLAASTARELGARSVGLVAPYLAYMRQDSHFKTGEGAASMHMARFLSASFDWLVTVDPHLHRHHSLDEIYSIPTRVVQSAPMIAAWIKQNVSRPVIVGPDAESEQWALKVARDVGCPHSILQKTRHGDRDVEVTAPQTGGWENMTPVIIDDIASTGKTMIAAIQHLRAAGLPAPVCIAVHGVFADGAVADMQAAGAGRIVTCNTIGHATNDISVEEAVASAAAEVMPQLSFAA